MGGSNDRNQNRQKENPAMDESVLDSILARARAAAIRRRIVTEPGPGELTPLSPLEREKVNQLVNDFLRRLPGGQGSAE